MKKTLYLLLFLITFVCCTNDETTFSVEEVINKGAYAGEGLSSSVTSSDVMTLVSSFRPCTRGTEEESYEYLVDDENDTLFFVVNYPEGGWTMYASDKRVPAVVAASDSGHFNLNNMTSTMGDWLELIAEDMKEVKHSTDERLALSATDIETNRAYWDAVCDVNSFLGRFNDSIDIRPGINDSLNIEPFPGEICNETGHYVLYNTESYTDVYDSVKHLTCTKWSQGSPYNMYCPYRTDGTERVPAGCVAIAGAQMLYYLHDAIGVPQHIPDTAYCYGDINNYAWGQADRGRDIWSKMPHHANKGYWGTDFCGNYVEEASFAAPLIANVAFLVGMDFGNNASGAKTEDLVNKVFNYYGVACQYRDFDINVVKNSLVTDGMPVIACAYATKKKRLFKTQYKDGHAFIVDGFKRECVKTVYKYRWENYDGKPNITVPDSIGITLTSPELTSICMNWGWGNYYYENATWCTPTGTWIAIAGEDGLKNYKYKRKIIHGFRPKQ